MPLPFTDPFKYKNNFTIDNLKYFAYQANTGKQQPVQFGDGQVVKIFHKHQPFHHHSTTHEDHSHNCDQHKPQPKSKWVREYDKA